MRINEVIQKVDLSKRAVKYYEQQGLLTVQKDDNGYRNYSQQNLTTLKEISVYRKLGICIQDIKTLLVSKDKQRLEQIYKEKSENLLLGQKELEALRNFIENQDVDTIYQLIDYQTIGQALKDMFPGFYGYYFMNHFMPYLQIQITNQAQQDAYKNIIEFWDNTSIKLPLFMRFTGYISYKFMSKASLEKTSWQLDLQLQKYLNPTKEDYVKLKNQTLKNVKMKNSLFFKYHPAFISQRKFMKRLQDQGYNDIFIPNMMVLSPKYKEYHDALMETNNQICNELGLYYDSNYNLVIKKNPKR